MKDMKFGSNSNTYSNNYLLGTAFDDDENLQIFFPPFGRKLE